MSSAPAQGGLEAFDPGLDHFARLGLEAAEQLCGREEQRGDFWSEVHQAGKLEVDEAPKSFISSVSCHTHATRTHMM